MTYAGTRFSVIDLAHVIPLSARLLPRTSRWPYLRECRPRNKSISGRHEKVMQICADLLQGDSAHVELALFDERLPLLYFGWVGPEFCRQCQGLSVWQRGSAAAKRGGDGSTQARFRGLSLFTSETPDRVASHWPCAGSERSGAVDPSLPSFAASSRVGLR